MLAIAMILLDDYVFDVLMRDLVAHDRRPVAFLVYLWFAKEHQRHGQAVRVSYRDIAESVGVSKSSAQAAVGWLVRRKLIVATKRSVTDTPQYRVLRPWSQEDRSTRHNEALASHTDSARRTRGGEDHAKRKNSKQ